VDAVANEDSVASSEGARRIAQAALGFFGRVDGVVNSAGNLWDSLFHRMTEEIGGGATLGQGFATFGTGLEGRRCSRRNVEVPAHTPGHGRADLHRLDAPTRDRPVPRGDHWPHMYFYPEIKQAFERRGIPHLLIETEHEGMPLEGLKTRRETFMEITRRAVAA
jgi:hypothetical protein